MTDRPEDDGAGPGFDAFARGVDWEQWRTDSPPLDFAERVTRRVRELPASQQRADGSVASTAPKRSRARLLGALALAAALASLALWLLPAGSERGSALSAERMEVEIAGRAVAVLEAQAEVEWDGSRVRQPRGDVFYRVDPGSEFRVHTPFGSVEVLGTCFRVQVLAGEEADAAGAASALVSVLEGRVRASSAGSSLVLGAGQSARLLASGVEAVSESAVRSAELAGKALAVLDDSERRSAPSADLEAEVSRLRQLVGRVQSHRARLEADLKRAEEELARAQGKPRERNEFDLSREDWLELAETGTIKFAVPCRNDWVPSGEAIDALGLAPGDAELIGEAYQRSQERLWSVLRPLCADVLGDESIADIVGSETCVHVIVDHDFKRNRQAANESMRQVAEVRAGMREAPPEAERTPTFEAFLALTGETQRYEQALAADFGPEDAKRIAYAAGLCRSTFGGPGPRKPER